MDRTRDEMLQAGPCQLCGATNYSLSMGDPLVCQSCDVGEAGPHANARLRQHNHRLQEENAKLRAALSAPAPDGDDDCATIDQRDRAEEWLGKLASLAGCEREWSNLHYHGQCIADALAPAPPDPELDALCERLQRARDLIVMRSGTNSLTDALGDAIDALRRTRPADAPTCSLTDDCYFDGSRHGAGCPLARRADAGEDGKS